MQTNNRIITIILAITATILLGLCIASVMNVN